MRLLAAGIACSFVAIAQAQAPQTGTAEPQSDPFDIWEYRVLGNTVLQPRDIETAVYPHLGPAKDIAAVQKARESLERVYRERGYATVFVDIPEQDVANGVVRLQVTEGKLDRIRVTGARYFSNGRIREQMTSLKQGAVPSIPQVQAQIAAVNALSSNRSITPVMRAGRAPGTVDIELRVKDELPLHGSFEVNDRYTADTSRLRVSANLSYDNLFQRNQSLALQFQTAPEDRDQAQVLAATYIARVASSGLMAVYAVDTDSDVAISDVSTNVATVGPLNVLGRGRIYGARYIALLPAEGSRFHNLSLGADFKDFEENLLRAAQTELFTPISYLGWSTVYSAGMRSERAATDFNIGAYFGLRRFANDAQEFDDKRVFADPNYFYIRGGASHLRHLWRGFGLNLRLAAQFSPAPLVSNEQFSIGGADSVRGYLESESLGDMGFSGSVELRSPSLAGNLSEKLNDFHLFGFYDVGLVSIIDPLPRQIPRFDLASTGVGFRLRGFSGLEAGLDWAHPLVPSTRVLDGDSRIHFTVKYGF